MQLNGFNPLSGNAPRCTLLYYFTLSNVSVNSSRAHPPGELAISGKKMTMSPPQEKKNCAKAPPLGKQIGSIYPPTGNNIDCLVHVVLHVIILCLWTI
jgi:hypothetical protein